MSEEQTKLDTYQIDITVYIDAPTHDRVKEIVDILKSKLLEVPGIRIDLDK